MSIIYRLWSLYFTRIFSLYCSRNSKSVSCFWKLKFIMGFPLFTFIMVIGIIFSTYSNIRTITPLHILNSNKFSCLRTYSISYVPKFQTLKHLSIECLVTTLLFKSSTSTKSGYYRVKFLNNLIPLVLPCYSSVSDTDLHCILLMLFLHLTETMNTELFTWFKNVDFIISFLFLFKIKISFEYLL